MISKLLSYNRGENVFLLVVIFGLMGFFSIYFITRLFKVVGGGSTEVDKDVSLVLLEGLNIPRGTKLKGRVTDSSISLENNDYDINIFLDKITSVIKSDVEISQKGISFKNAVIGGALFGEFGAAIGAFKGKESIKIESVVISYKDKEDEIQSVAFIPDCLVRGTFNILDAKNDLKYFYSKLNKTRTETQSGKTMIEI